MTRTATIGLTAALVGLGSLAADASAARHPAAHAKSGYTAPKKFDYTGEVRASYTIALTDSASEMTGRTTMQVRYSTPLVFSAYEAQISTERAPSGRQQGVATITVSVAGRDRAGCEFAFDRRATTRMMLNASAGPVTVGSIRLVTKPVRAGYQFVLDAHAVGPLPKLTTACNLDERIYLLSLRDLLQVALWYESAETALAGAWPRATRVTGFDPTTIAWPFVPLVYQQVWATRPVKQAGAYRLPAPAAKLASGKPLTITKSLAREYPVAGEPSVTIKTTGTITFSFKPRR